MMQLLQVQVIYLHINLNFAVFNEHEKHINFVEQWKSNTVLRDLGTKVKIKTLFYSKPHGNENCYAVRFSFMLYYLTF